MTVTIKYFGAIAEATGKTEEKVNLDDAKNSIDQLREMCLSKYENIGDLSFQIAINQSLSDSRLIEDGDEVAFLPPFAGG